MERRRILPLLSLLFCFAFSQETKPGCPSKCGNVSIPYPFGIGLRSGCSIGPWYDIICNTSFDPPKAFLPGPLFSFSSDITANGIASPVEVVDVSMSHVRIRNTISSSCFNVTGGFTRLNTAGLVVATCFTLSQLNKLFVIGCDDYTVTSSVRGIDQKRVSSGCLSVCSKPEDVIVGSCTGIIF